MSKKGIIVTGMHRSGTSAVSNFLHNLGVDAGDPDRLLGSARDNQEGFFERHDVMEINDDLLEHLNSSWDNPHASIIKKLSEIDIPLDLFNKMKGVLYAYESVDKPFFVKDPRFCLTLSLWLKLWHDPIIIVCLRNPLEIARSLQKRNGFSVFKGLGLWENYFDILHNQFSQQKVVRVNFNLLVQQPDVVGRLLCIELEQLGVDGLEYKSSVIGSTFNRSLKHEECSEQEMEEFLTIRQMDLWSTVKNDPSYPDIECAPSNNNSREHLRQRNVDSGYADHKIELFPVLKDREILGQKLKHQLTKNKLYEFNVLDGDVRSYVLKIHNKRCVVKHFGIMTISEGRSECIRDFSHNGQFDYERGCFVFYDDSPAIKFNSSMRGVSKVIVSIDFMSLQPAEVDDLVIHFLGKQQKRQKYDNFSHDREHVNKIKRKVYKILCHVYQGAKCIISPREVFAFYRNYSLLASHEAFFSARYYLAHNPDIARSLIDPLYHFLTKGVKEDRNPSPYFDITYYCGEYKDAGESCENILYHFITEGWKDGKNPSAALNTNEYIALNPSCLENGNHILVHYHEAMSK